MMRNKIAWKLAAYFAAAIAVFALVMGISFGHFFHETNVATKKNELLTRSKKTAAIMGDNMERLRERGINGTLGSRRLIGYINTITDCDVWVVDKSQTIEMRNRVPENGAAELPKVQGKLETRHGPQGRDLPPSFVGVGQVGDLPEVYRTLIKQSFKGEAQVQENFDKVGKEVMVTAAAPVYDKAGGVAAVLLLRTPIFGLRQAWESGLSIFAISFVAAMLLALLVAAILSLKFTEPLTKMKDAAEKLAERDYTARCYVSQNDEVGELATTLDGLAGRLEQVDKEAQKLDKLRKEFIANVSHELRTPVTVLRGSLEALRDKVVTDPEEVDRYHETMYKETLFLQRLINDLLELSRLQNTDFAIEKSPLNFCEVVQEAVRNARHLGRGKGITVAYEGDTELYRLQGDYGRLTQMLMVFLDNAIKFSKEKGTIEVSLKGDRLAIMDHGVGIKKEDLQHVFDRFYKTRIEKNKSGSGLGLAIAKEIAERHGIIPAMYSEYGHSTTVELILPGQEKV